MHDLQLIIVLSTGRRRISKNVLAPQGKGNGEDRVAEAVHLGFWDEISLVEGSFGPSSHYPGGRILYTADRSAALSTTYSQGRP